MIHLVLGGARSGKSSFAEGQALALSARNPSGQLYYLATSTPYNILYEEDLEPEQGSMQARIDRHRQTRDAEYVTIEEPLFIAKELAEKSPNDVVLVDCLTLWLSNCLMQNFDEKLDQIDLKFWSEQKQAFLTLLENCPCHLVLVSNEVGQGIIPLGELNRVFVDESGWLHQAIAKQADKVSFIVAGLEQRLKA